jgi:ketosteroid isomerase-like protein
MTPEQMDRKLEEHFQFEAREDVDGVMATLADDVEHDVVGWPSGPTRGREAPRAFYEALFGDLAQGQIRSLKRLYGDRFMVDDSIWSGIAVGRPFGLQGNDRPLEFRVLHVLEFSDEGAIQRENVWVDLASVIQQLPQD